MFDICLGFDGLMRGMFEINEIRPFVVRNRNARKLDRSMGVREHDSVAYGARVFEVSCCIEVS